MHVGERVRAMTVCRKLKDEIRIAFASPPVRVARFRDRPSRVTADVLRPALTPQCIHIDVSSIVLGSTLPPTELSNALGSPTDPETAEKVTKRFVR